MFVIDFLKEKKKEDFESPDKTIYKIQKGDVQLREDFIKKYSPFIIKQTSQYCGKYVEIENSDHYSIALIAFNEAIDAYVPDKNSSFINFASLVIQRRISNHTKAISKNSNTYPFSQIENDKSFDRVMVIEESEVYKKVEISEELGKFKKELSKYKITLKELVSLAPKHKDSRIMCLDIAKKIVKNKVLFERLKRTKNIPVKDLLEIIDVYRGTLEKNRKYIISLCLILDSDLDTIKSFMQNVKAGDLNV